MPPLLTNEQYQKAVKNENTNYATAKQDLEEDGWNSK